MKEKLKIAVVGSHLCNLNIKKEFDSSGHSCEIFNTPSDSQSLPLDRIIYSPFDRETPHSKIINKVSNVDICFTEQLKKESLWCSAKKFNQGLESRFCHKAVFNKLISVSLFSDLTPSLWSDNKPNRSWVKKTAYSDINKSFYQPQWGDAASDANSTGKIVEKIEYDELAKKHVLFFNAPHASEIYETLIFSNRAQQFHSNVKFYWQTFEYEVNRKSLTSLSEFSIWLNTNSLDSDFMKTGIITDQCLYRVFKNNLSEDKSRLIVQILRDVNSQNEATNPITALRKFCPWLKSGCKSHISYINPEDYLFESPERFIDIAKDKSNSFYYHIGPHKNYKQLTQFFIRNAGAIKKDV